MVAPAASRQAMPHTSVDRESTGMPMSRARSAFSAMPRTATPESVRNRNQLNRPSTTGTKASRSRSLPSMTTGKNVVICVDDSGVVKVVTSALAPNIGGTRTCIPPSTWARPMVATVSTSRDEPAKRRMTNRSTITPTRMPTTQAAATATNQGTPQPENMEMPTAAANPPVAP